MVVLSSGEGHPCIAVIIHHKAIVLCNQDNFPGISKIVKYACQVAHKHLVGHHLENAISELLAQVQRAALHSMLNVLKKLVERRQHWRLALLQMEQDLCTQ